MSIVTIHGPYTFGSKAVAGNVTGTVSATVNAANGLIWTFTPKDQSQVAANYDWTYSPAGGTPASPLVDTKNPVFTFTAGTKTVILTLNGVAQAPITVTAVAGVAPRELDEGTQTQSVGTDEGQHPDQREESPEVPIAFDPAAHNVTEVETYADEHPDQAQELLDAEVAGKNRTTLVAFLEGMLPFDPGAHTVTEVISYVEDNPEEIEDVIDAERDGKGRVTLLTHLESMRS